ncbi:hypothetical protein M885DRAFT_586543 [Pelagophyceae sp. CCMP2097]|nr:hypothetical protein M885DRAFT_586543 [Pelagophyceae sp. CCMP2097]
MARVCGDLTTASLAVAFVYFCAGIILGAVYVAKRGSLRRKKETARKNYRPSQLFEPLTCAVEQVATTSVLRKGHTASKCKKQAPFGSVECRDSWVEPECVDRFFASFEVVCGNETQLDTRPGVSCGQVYKRKSVDVMRCTDCACDAEIDAPASPVGNAGAVLPCWYVPAARSKVAESGLYDIDCLEPCFLFRDPHEDWLEARRQWGRQETRHKQLSGCPALVCLIVAGAVVFLLLCRKVCRRRSEQAQIIPKERANSAA